MRKNFLILMLLTLLPLAGWAQGYVNLSGFSITFVDNNDQDVPEAIAFNNTNRMPLIKLSNGNQTIAQSEGKFTVTWKKGNAIVDQIVHVGQYVVEVTAKAGQSYGELDTPTKSLWIMQAADNVITNLNAVQATLSLGGEWTEDGFDSFTQPVLTTYGTPKYLATQGAEPNANTDGWSTDIPTVTKVGANKIYCMVAESDDYNAVNPTLLGTVTITGQAIPQNIVDAAAPTANNNLSFTNEPKQLITAGQLDEEYGKLWYKVGNGDWSKAIPTETNAGQYVVSWKIVGAEGKADYDQGQAVNVSIGKGTPTVIPATGATNLIYKTDGDHKRALLSIAGSANFGASVVYNVRYNADPDYNWTNDNTTPYGNDNYTNYTAVKGENAGSYQIKTEVLGDNNVNASSATTIVKIGKATAFTTAPKATNPIYTGQAQALIEEAEGTITGIVQYKVGDGNYSNQIPSATDINTYNVTYKVDDPNFGAVPEATIKAKILGKPLTVKVNDVKKTYDGTTGLANASLVSGTDKFTFITEDPNFIANNYANLDYAAIVDNNPNDNIDYVSVSTYEGVVTVTKQALQTIDSHYDYTIIPGNLTVNQKEISVAIKNTVLTNGNLETTLDHPFALNDDLNQDGISDLLVVNGLVGNDDIWATAPTLTSNDAPATLVPGTYNLTITAGTLNAAAGANYKLAQNAFATNVKYVVNPEAGSKISITIVPGKKKTYGDADPDWTQMAEGTDYYVAGKVPGDVLTITFTRAGRGTADGEKAGTYALTATAEVDNPQHYEDAISITNSTFTIEKKVLTPTVNKQVVKQNAQALPDPDGWSVEGLVNATVDGVEINDTKESLNAQALAMSSTTNVTNDGTITLTIPNNGNYKFVDNNGNDIFTATGTLIVISETTLMLDPADLDLVSKIQTAANSQIDYNIAFAQGFELNTQEWYAMVLPFATTPAELVNALGTYVLVNKLSSAVKKEDGSADVKFALEWNKIEAGEPFLIKTAIKVDNNQNSIPVEMSQVQFAAKGIVKDITDVVKGVATFTGTYENGKSVKWNYNLDGTENTEMRYRWLSHTNTLRPGKTANDPETTEAEKKAKYYLDNEWKQPKSNAHTLIPMEAFLILAPEITKANIFVEDIENGFTAIKNLSADQVNGMTVATKGWYTLNGVKLQGAPTEKGIYINNGKKVVIK